VRHDFGEKLPRAQRIVDSKIENPPCPAVRISAIEIAEKAPPLPPKSLLFIHITRTRHLIGGTKVDELSVLNRSVRARAQNENACDKD
jgi:hypothetical protein